MHGFGEPGVLDCLKFVANELSMRGRQTDGGSVCWLTKGFYHKRFYVFVAGDVIQHYGDRL